MSKTDLARVGDLHQSSQSVSYCKTLFNSRQSAAKNALTHLVEVLQQVDYPALNLVLGQTGRRGVESDRLRDEARGELRHTSSNGRGADLEGSRGLHSGTGGGGPQGAGNGGAEHDESIDQERNSFRSKQ